MKKLGISILILITLLLAAIVLLPIIFKDDIKAALDEAIQESVNARVYYDDQSMEISLFENFPDISISMGNFGIVGIEQFASDTLVSVDQFSVGLDLMSVIKGEQIAINSVRIERPSVLVLVMSDGSANYDLAKPGTTTTETSASTSSGSSGVSLTIKEWEIIDGDLAYLDQSLPFYTILNNINHNGSGNFEQDIFDMITKTTVSSVSLGYDGVEYLANKEVVADITMGMDFASSTYTFKENLVTVNALPISADGFLQLAENGDIVMDFTYEGVDIGIKSILSLVPGVYNDYLNGLSASGAVDLTGYVRGTYNDNSLPAVHTETHIKDGSLKYADFPTPIENIQLGALFDFPSADLRETSLEVEQFTMTLEGEKTTAKMKLFDFEQFHWDIFVDSHMDLEKLTKVIHLEDGMTLKGRINGTVNSKGSVAAIDASNLDGIPTSGTLNVKDFYFASEEVTEPFSISEANIAFDPQKITLQRFDASLGKSDFAATGQLTNHLAYAFKEGEVLKGNLNFNAGSINLDELMTKSSDEVATTTSQDSTVTADSTVMEAVEIPKNIDFTLASKIDRLVYDGLDITNLNGTILVKDGQVILDNEFELLKGQFSIAGAYATENIEEPTFDFKLGIANLSIPEAFKSFESVQKFAPVAQKMTGSFSTDFALSGVLDAAMNPQYDRLTGSGLLEIAQASLENMKSLQALTLVSKLGDSDGIVALKDVLMSAELRDGRVYLEPFDVKIGSYQTNIAGSNGIDGSLDYDLRMDVPSSSVTSSITSTLTQFVGESIPANSDMVLRINMGGTYDDPKPTLAGVETKQGQSIQSSVKDQVKTQVKEQKDAAAEEAKAVKDSLVNEGKTKINETKEQIKDQTKETVTKEVDKVKDQIKNLFKKKKKKKKDN